MAINLGSTAIADAKLGTTQVEKIYLGSEEVWSKSTPVSIKALKFSSEGTQTLSVDTTKLGSISPVFEYSLDNGNTWTTWNVRGGGIQFGNGTDLYLRGNNTNLALAGDNYVRFIFDSTGPVVDCSGNIMHLFDSTQDLTYFPGGVNSRGCKRMFYGSGRLHSAPDLPATTLCPYCYNSMFANCTSLLAPPALPAPSVNNGAYSYMFTSSAIRSIPLLSASYVDSGGYEYMFLGCNSIKMSLTQDATYTNKYEFGVTPSISSADSMFASTGGTFTGTPTVQTLYTSNSIVRA